LMESIVAYAVYRHLIKNMHFARLFSPCQAQRQRSSAHCYIWGATD
jgi:hypothetical protein